MSFIPNILQFITIKVIKMVVVTNSISFAKKNRYILNCLIVEDDYAFALDTKIRAEEIGLKVIAIAANFKEIEKALSDYSIDIILSDVKLNSDEYVYDYFNKIDNLPPLILFSGLDSMDVYEKSKVSNPYVFLVKPFDDITLRSAVEGALKNVSEALDDGSDIYGNKDVLYVRSAGKLLSIKTEDILYVKSEGNYCTIYFENRRVAIRASIGKVLKMSNKSYLIQIHRSYIANISKITELFSGKNLLVLGDVELPIGRKYKKQVVEEFQKKLG